MRKNKKRLNRRINPEKSNKMIWAVSSGLLILFVTLFITSIGTDSISDKTELYKNTLSYINKIEGITDVESIPEINSVKIFYDPDPNSRSMIDYKKMAVFAGVKLSNKLKGEKITFQLIRKLEKKVELTFSVQDGKVVSKILPE
ncbi:MAG: hypothetical protein KAS21_00370 [Candidatus Aminicenantes bacterium]|nr:hypothetical protein [Candidatus Aminicenantes bacterium]